MGRERQRGRQEQMRRAWEREGWRRAELQWVHAAAGRTVAEQGRQGRQLAAEATEAAATPTGDSQQRDAEAACARDWSRHWQAGAFAAWGWGG